MKQNKDWTDVMRSALRDAEVTPPADGWARLERELGPAPRISVLRSQWPRIAAAAAAVLIFLGGVSAAFRPEIMHNPSSSFPVVWMVYPMSWGGVLFLHRPAAGFVQECY